MFYTLNHSPKALAKNLHYSMLLEIETAQYTCTLNGIAIVDIHCTFALVILVLL